MIGRGVDFTDDPYGNLTFANDVAHDLRFPIGLSVPKAAPIHQKSLHYTVILRHG